MSEYVGEKLCIGMREPPQPKSPVVLTDGREGVVVSSWYARGNGGYRILVDLIYDPDRKAVVVGLRQIRAAQPAAQDKKVSPRNGNGASFERCLECQRNSLIISNLTMFIRRLMHGGNPKVKEQVQQYLESEGLQGTVLRKA